MFTEKDIQQFKEKGIEKSVVESQIRDFEKGFDFLSIESAASLGNGIKTVGAEEYTEYRKIWQAFLNAKDSKIYKFVPASGAASRMFKDLFEYLNSGEENKAVRIFLDNIHDFAFAEQLDKVLVEKTQKGIDEHISSGSQKEIVRYLLEPCGLNYGNLPKGLLTFHRYDDVVRTAVEEHLIEACTYEAKENGECNVHFTVSPEHIELFKTLVQRVAPGIEKSYEVKFNVTYSIQKPSTDTIAVTADNTPFRNDDGSILFRPGGHGALIHNLNDLDADVVFIKNIDNVSSDLKVRASVTTYEFVMAGVLVSVQEKLFNYLRRLDAGECDDNLLSEIADFCEETLLIKNKSIRGKSKEEQVRYFTAKLNRPIRICGMVRNEGEPGGGPYYINNSDGSVGLQILESSQIDKSNKQYVDMMANSTHFNPVDLICSLKNYRGEKFDLLKYVDESCGFISSKSKNGVELKALELPGLWNGAMSDWNTIFFEYPVLNFNPVKTVNDLLREQHR